MDIDLPHGPRHNNNNNNAPRSSNGCWTCRLRRKKCDEKRPVCDICAALHITCHYALDKPEWMDGGARQEEMAERVKREVRDNAHLRRTLPYSGDRGAEGVVDAVTPPNGHPGSILGSVCDVLKRSSGPADDRIAPCVEASKILPRRGMDCKLNSKDPCEGIAFGRSDTVLIMFYLEHVLPFLFPFYHPSPLQGGRAWILEMMISSPVVRRATLCQSSYFFSLARGTAPGDVAWETVLMQTRDAFGILRQSLQVIHGSAITEHLHGAVRIMASIMQVQRFEIAVLSFDNCRAHLNAALALFKQLLGSAGTGELATPSSGFASVLSRLGPSTLIPPAQSVQVPSAEQAAFHFSSALLILDDIVAGTVLQEPPSLYECHRCLLGDTGGTEPLINMEAVVGCQNWALLQIGEIAVLDAWKQRCNRAGNLDVMDLVHRARVIKEDLEARLMRVEAESIVVSTDRSDLLGFFPADGHPPALSPTRQTSLVTRVWAHAALAYLFVVVSGWQPASPDVQYHVGRIIELLTHQISSPALLRTMVWPFCVAGCLAQPGQEVHMRGMVDGLRPRSVFGTVCKALEIMENVWQNRERGDVASRDLATCFRSQGDLVLLV